MGAVGLPPSVMKREGREERQMKVHLFKWLQLGDFKPVRFLGLNLQEADLKQICDLLKAWNDVHEQGRKRDISISARLF